MINDVSTVHALKTHLVAFLGLAELARQFGLDDAEPDTIFFDLVELDWTTAVVIGDGEAQMKASDWSKNYANHL